MLVQSGSTSQCSLWAIIHKVLLGLCINTSPYQSEAEAAKTIWCCGEHAGLNWINNKDTCNAHRRLSSVLCVCFPEGYKDSYTFCTTFPHLMYVCDALASSLMAASSLTQSCSQTHIYSVYVYIFILMCISQKIILSALFSIWTFSGHMCTWLFTEFTVFCVTGYICQDAALTQWRHNKEISAPILCYTTDFFLGRSFWNFLWFRIDLFSLCLTVYWRLSLNIRIFI